MSHHAEKWARSQLLDSPSERNVLLAIAKYHNDATGLCCPAYATIAKIVGLSRRHVMRLALALERYGLITIKRRISLGDQITNQFDLACKTALKARSMRGDNLQTALKRWALVGLRWVQPAGHYDEHVIPFPRSMSPEIVYARVIRAYNPLRWLAPRRLRFPAMAKTMVGGVPS